MALLAGPVMAATLSKPNVVILFVDDMGIDQIEVPPAQRDCEPSIALPHPFRPPGACFLYSSQPLTFLIDVLVQRW